MVHGFVAKGSYFSVHYKFSVFEIKYVKKITLNKNVNCLCIPHAAHSETLLFFPINNIIFRIIIYLFNQNK